MKKMVGVIAVLMVVAFAGVALAEHPSEWLVQVKGDKAMFAPQMIIMIKNYVEGKAVHAAGQFNGWLANGSEWANADRLKKTTLTQNGGWFEVPLVYVTLGNFNLMQVGDPALKNPMNHNWLESQFLPGMDIKKNPKDLPSWMVLNANGAPEINLMGKMKQAAK